MNLVKSTNTQNFASLNKVQIIKDVYVTNLPFALSINLSEIEFSTGQQFNEIEITDGTYSITDDDEGHGTIYKVQANFRHPKVREDAELFLKTFRGRLVRLVLTDKNGVSRLTPSGKITIQENVSDMPNYNGYNIEFNAVGEQVPFINLDAYAIPPLSLWDTIFNDWHFTSNILAIVNKDFDLNFTLKCVEDNESFLTIDFNGILEELSFQPGETKTILRHYTVTQESYLAIRLGRFINGIFISNFGLYFYYQDSLTIINAGMTRFFTYSTPGHLDLSGNSIISSDLDELLKQYQIILNQPVYWGIDEYFYIDGSGEYGFNGTPFSAEALAIKAKMIQIRPLSYRDNS
ncbi:MAG: hypothetical protein WCX31_04625 [Salinivirgaceae bacterium]|jgi:hypothetical protein